MLPVVSNQKLNEIMVTYMNKDNISAFDNQIAGSHYKMMAIQPLELTLLNLGYEAFKGACYTKINKYCLRKKDDEVEQLKKAQHVLSMWIEEAEKRANGDGK